MEENIYTKSGLKNQIEAMLFYAGEPVEVKTLAKTLEMSEEETASALEDLGHSLSNRGIRLVIHAGAASLATAPEHAELIERVIREERERDLGRAGLETLSIIAYKGPVSKKEIEYIRGVNCQFVLRSLLLRGLVEKKPSDTDGRLMVYSVTEETVRYLGLGSISELPEYAETRAALEVSEDEEVEVEKGNNE